MKIVAHKTNYYLNDEFFSSVIMQSYVDGVVFDVTFNLGNQILVYDYSVSIPYSVQQLQNSPIQELHKSNIMTLEEALDDVRRNRSNIAIYLNVIPISVNIVDDASLKQLNEINARYIDELDRIIKKFADLSIAMHSVSRNLALLLQDRLINSKIGFVITAGDLTPTDVPYYVFPTYMLDDEIIEELIKFNKYIYIYISDESDLALIVERYDSEKSTALAQKNFPYLNFITNQPSLVERVFTN